MRSLLTVSLLLALPSPLRAGSELDPLRRIAIQEGGRVKPLDTFARETSKRVTAARAFGAQSVMGLDPVEWMIAMLADPARWRQEPIIRVTHVGLRQAAQLPDGKDHFSFDELSQHPGFLKAAEAVHEKQRKDREAKLNPIEREISTQYDTLGLMQAIFSGDAFRVIPHPTSANESWYSLRDLEGADLPPPVLRVKTLLAALLLAEREGDRAGIGSAGAALERRLAELAPEVYPKAEALDREVHYNQLKPFRLAWFLYLVGLLALMPRLLPAWPGMTSILLGFGVQAYGMLLRVLISGRPPVTNMYESVIWVAWGAVLFALIFEAVYGTRWFAMCASSVAIVCLILADSVPILDGSIEPLVPVLRDNMWLTIHVLTITLSYAAYFLAMAIGHVNLALYFFAPQRRELLAQLSNFLYRTLQVGTLLCAAGTMLGGWWASYSWGRFWGWDAKETSIFVALLIYLAVLHGRMVGLLRDFGTAVASVLAFLGVLWAWYGVNFVLGVGLHSYGFGSGGYAYVGGFVALELAIVAAAVLKRQGRLPQSDTAAGLPSSLSEAQR